MLNGWLHEHIYLDANDDGGGGGGVAAPEAPAAPVSPADAANARIDAAVQAGMGDEPLGDGEPPAAGADDDTLLDNLPYRDAKKLREQQTALKQRFKPFEDAFGGLPDDQRETVLGALGGLGPDAASTIQLVGSMHAEDRSTLLGAYAQLMSTDPEQKAQGIATFRQIADALSGDQPAGAGVPTGEATAPAPAVPGLDDDPERPLTRAELDQWAAQRDEQRAQQQAQADALTQIHQEMRDLGYDPEAADPAQAARADYLVSVASLRTGGDLAKAHEIIQAERQAVIDEYVASKAANARPGQPDTGSSPSGTVEPSKVDPLHAAESRLEAAFGPDPRRRRL